MLEFARPPSLSLVPADPRAPVEEAVAGVEAEWAARGVTFVRKMPERMPPGALDPVRVRTAVKILCRQAAVAAEEAGGGAVEVTIRGALAGVGALGRRSRADACAADLRENAFVPFTPQRARGSGLGLAVVARIARRAPAERRASRSAQAEEMLFL